MKEVICISKHWRTANGQYVTGPAYEEVCKVKGETEIKGCLFYILLGYEETNGLTNLYNSVEFVDITGTQEEIEKALEAPTPIKELIERELGNYFEPIKYNYTTKD